MVKTLFCIDWKQCKKIFLKTLIIFEQCVSALYTLCTLQLQWRLVGFIEGGAQIFPSFFTMTILN